ncbi:muscle M-line assembly protein unc-89-like [Cylas formicarius]|uniref:muscle M-line assembly protein unc-89-like n=1 Tax=Cylas formicarius TaxID=197179 RepID=UPI0029584733|nr:muscle M-line assembly protein unc-89-like [Cylas formicarius]
MADTEAQKKVESTIEEKKVEEKEKIEATKEDKKEENGDKVDKDEAKVKTPEKAEKKSEDKDSPVTDKCTIKRKSTAGDVTDGKATSESTPEKKAKVDDASPEAESNGDVAEAEVAA